MRNAPHARRHPLRDPPRAARSGGTLGRLGPRVRAAGQAEGDEGGEATQTLPVPDLHTQTSLDRPWQVIVWDDPVNLMNYVVYVFQRVLGLSAAEAEARMLEVHNEGRSVVANEARERAEFLVARLHAYGLQATLEKRGD